MLLKGTSISTVATFPPGFFLENITTLPDDTLLVTVANRKCVYAIPPPTSPDQPRQPHLLHQFEDDAWALGIVTSPGNPSLTYVLTTDFTSQGSCTHHLRLLDITNVAAAGHLTKLMQFPAGTKGLNGLALLSETVLLAADSFAGCIWRIDIELDKNGKPRGAQASEWLRDPAFAGKLVLPDFQPGVNGLKYSRAAHAIVFSSTQQRLFGKVAIDPEAWTPSGPVEILLHGPQGDDLLIDDDFEGGPVAYLTTHRDNSILRVPLLQSKTQQAGHESQEGVQQYEVVAEVTMDDQQVLGPTAGSWQWGREGKTAYITCDGGLKNPFPAGTTPQHGRILKIDMGV